MAQNDSTGLQNSGNKINVQHSTIIQKDHAVNCLIPSQRNYSLLNGYESKKKKVKFKLTSTRSDFEDQITVAWFDCCVPAELSATSCQ